MSGRFLMMLLIGTALMVAMWVKMVDHDKDEMNKDLATYGCLSDTPCPKDAPLCVAGPTVKSGVCSNFCKRANECPDNWCCGEAKNAKGEPSRCIPPTECPQK
jgi:hypothetical protein